MFSRCSSGSGLGLCALQSACKLGVWLTSGTASFLGSFGSGLGERAILSARKLGYWFMSGTVMFQAVVWDLVREHSLYPRHLRSFSTTGLCVSCRLKFREHGASS